MRLSTDQIQAIRQAATAAFGQGTSVWLFGSRVDDAKKGGDIDLLVCPQAHTTEDATVGQQGFMDSSRDSSCKKSSKLDPMFFFDMSFPFQDLESFFSQIQILFGRSSLHQKK